MDKYFKATNIAFQNCMEYKANFWSRHIYSIIPLVANLILWMAIYEQSPSGINMTRNEIIIYYLLVLVVDNLTLCTASQSIAGEIKQGELSKYLVKPCNYMIYKLFYSLGDNIMFLLLCGIPLMSISIIIAIISGTGINCLRLFLFLLAIVLGYIINFFVNYCISVLAFFLAEVGSFFFALETIKGLITGKVFPISLIPGVLYKVLLYSPFQYICYFPIVIILGKYTMVEIVRQLLIGVCWAFGLILLSRTLWKVGLKKYTSIGG